MAIKIFYAFVYESADCMSLRMKEFFLMKYCLCLRLMRDHDEVYMAISHYENYLLNTLLNDLPLEVCVCGASEIVCFMQIIDASISFLFAVTCKCNSRLKEIKKNTHTAAITKNKLKHTNAGLNRLTTSSHCIVWVSQCVLKLNGIIYIRLIFYICLKHQIV